MHHVNRVQWWLSFFGHCSVYDDYYCYVIILLYNPALLEHRTTSEMTVTEIFLPLIAESRSTAVLGPSRRKYPSEVRLTPLVQRHFSLRTEATNDNDFRRHHWKEQQGGRILPSSAFSSPERGNNECGNERIYFLDFARRCCLHADITAAAAAAGHSGSEGSPNNEFNALRLSLLLPKYRNENQSPKSWCVRSPK